MLNCRNNVITAAGWAESFRLNQPENIRLNKPEPHFNLPTQQLQPQLTERTIVATAPADFIPLPEKEPLSSVIIFGIIICIGLIILWRLLKNDQRVIKKSTKNHKTHNSFIPKAGKYKKIARVSNSASDVLATIYSTDSNVVFRTDVDSDDYIKNLKDKSTR